jgi:uncharacterized protein YndB with AHSA1/START domain
MATTIVTPDQDAVVSEIQISAPPERVFQALTDAGELKHWFGSPDCPVKFWQFDARVGGRYSYETGKGSIVVNGVSEFKCHGQILEYDPPRVLVWETGTTTPRNARSCAGSSRRILKARTYALRTAA